MADDKLTQFLTDLFFVDKTLEAFEMNRSKALKDAGVSQDTIEIFENNDRDGLKSLIGNNQGGGGTREREANRLAKRATDLAKTSVDMATSAAALAQSLRTGQGDGAAKPKNSKKR
jgi:hypothetical protein